MTKPLRNNKMLTGTQAKNILIGATISDVVMHGDESDASWFALKLVTGEVITLLADWNHNIGLRMSDYDQSVWFTSEEENNDKT